MSDEVTFPPSVHNREVQRQLDLSDLDKAMSRLRHTVQDTEDKVIAARKRAWQREADRGAVRAEIGQNRGRAGAR